MEDVPGVTGETDFGDRLETLTDATMRVARGMHQHSHQLARIELTIAAFAIIGFAFYFARTGVKA